MSHSVYNAFSKFVFNNPRAHWCDFVLSPILLLYHIHNTCTVVMTSYPFPLFCVTSDILWWVYFCSGDQNCFDLTHTVYWLIDPYLQFLEVKCVWYPVDIVSADHIQVNTFLHILVAHSPWIVISFTASQLVMKNCLIKHCSIIRCAYVCM